MKISVETVNDSGVGAERVRRPRRGRAEALDHRADRQPEDGEAVEEHDEPEATAVEPPEQRGTGSRRVLGAVTGASASAARRARARVGREAADEVGHLAAHLARHRVLGVGVAVDDRAGDEARR